MGCVRYNGACAESGRVDMNDTPMEVCLKCGVEIDDTTTYHDKCEACAEKLGLPLKGFLDAKMPAT